MKKLIVLLIILAMVNVANAGIIDIVIASLNGQPIDPHVNEITITPTDEVDLAIIFTAPASEYLYGLGVTVNVDGPATMDYSQLVAHAAFDGSLEVINPPEIIESGGLGNGPQGAGEPIDVVWNILLHCDGLEDVVVWLTDDQLMNTIVIDADYNILDYEYSPAITIHQPEPMTLALLGLGSLLIRRRKR